MIIFSYTGSPPVKISQKVLGGGATFFDSYCRLVGRFSDSRQRVRLFSVIVMYIHAYRYHWIAEQENISV